MGTAGAWWEIQQASICPRQLLRQSDDASEETGSVLKIKCYNEDELHKQGDWIEELGEVLKEFCSMKIQENSKQAEMVQRLCYREITWSTTLPTWRGSLTSRTSTSRAPSKKCCSKRIISNSNYSHHRRSQSCWTRTVKSEHFSHTWHQSASRSSPSREKSTRLSTSTSAQTLGREERRRSIIWRCWWIPGDKPKSTKEKKIEAGIMHRKKITTNSSWT